MAGENGIVSGMAGRYATALFELAVDVMNRAEDAGEGEAVAKSIAATKLDTLVGPISWGSDKLPPFAVVRGAEDPLVGLKAHIRATPDLLARASGAWSDGS